MKTHPLTRRSLMAAAAAVLAQAAVLAPAHAQGYPAKPVRMVVPMPPGGSTDGTARLLAEKLEARWRQPVLVENKPGAGSIVGTQLVARSPADGYTFGMVISAFTINPALRSDLPYDTLNDFTPLTLLGRSLMALVAHPSFPAQDVAGLIAQAKSKPGSISYASLGVGTATHLAGELLKTRTGIEWTHVPYNGSAPAYQDLLAGRVPVGFVVLQSALPHVKAGKLKLLGLTNAERSRLYPEFPTIGETVKDYGVESVIGFVAPKGLPVDAASKLSGDLIAVATEQDMEKRLAELGTEVVASKPQAFQAFISEEISKWKPVVQAAGMRDAKK